ncbi:MAG: SgcJ/EcaC family oxidoreductase [Candidatus Acidiferrales bacterium]
MSRSSSTLLLLSALFVTSFVTACSKQPAPPLDTRAADEAAIRAASAAWSKASVARDVDKTVAVYTSDAISMSQNSPLVRGKENIRKGWAEMLAQQGPGLSFATTGVEVARSGDIAYEYGTYDFATTDKRGKINDEKGKYLVIWKKQADQSWKVAVDMDNRDAAPQPPPAQRKPAAHKKRRRR